MRGILKHKPAGNQFLVLIGITIVSFLFFSTAGFIVASRLTGMSLQELAQPEKWNYKSNSVIIFFRVSQTAQFFGAFLVPCFLCAYFFSSNSRKYLGLRQPESVRFYAWAVFALLLAIPLVSLLGQLNQQIPFTGSIGEWMKKMERDSSKTLTAVLSKQTPADVVINLVVIALFAAVGEELLMRGMVQRLLIKMFRNEWAGILIAAALFSALHLQFAGFFPRFFLGILLGAAYWYSRSLWVAIAAHFVYDAYYVIMVYFKPEKVSNDKTFQWASLVASGLVSAVITFYLVYRMKKDSTNTFAAAYKEDALPVKNHPF